MSDQSDGFPHSEGGETATQDAPAPRAQLVDPQPVSPDGSPQPDQPADQKPKAGDLEAQQQKYLKEQESIYEATKQHIDAWEQQSKASMHYLNQLMQGQQKQDDAMERLLTSEMGNSSQPPPQRPQQGQALQQPGSKSKLLSFALMAIPLAIAFGRRGGASTWAAIGALGAGLKAFEQGNHAQAVQQYQYWQQYAKWAHEQKTERLNLYKEILANRRLSMEQQMKLLEMAGRQFHDRVLGDKAQAGAVNEVVRNLQHKEQALSKERKTTNKVAKGYLTDVFNTPEGKAYRAKMISQHGIDPARSDEDFQKAMKYMDYPEFIQRYKNLGKDETSLNDPKENNPLGLPLPRLNTPEGKARVNAIAGGEEPKVDIAGAAPDEEDLNERDAGRPPIEDDRPPEQ
jgi:hypothetical protein